MVALRHSAPSLHRRNEFTVRRYIRHRSNRRAGLLSWIAADPRWNLKGTCFSYALGAGTCEVENASLPIEKLAIMPTTCFWIGRKLAHASRSSGSDSGNQSYAALSEPPGRTFTRAIGGWLGILAVLVAAGALVGLRYFCRRAAARLPIDPTIGLLRDPQRDNLGVCEASNLGFPR